MKRWVPAKVPIRYGFCLPRWGSRVRTPSRALFLLPQNLRKYVGFGDFVYCSVLENRLTPWLTPLTVEMAKVRHFLSVPLIIVKTVCKKFVASSALAIDISANDCCTTE